MPYTRNERMLNLVKMAKGNENNTVKRKIYCSISQDITSKLPIKEHKPFDNDNKTNIINTIVIFCNLSCNYLIILSSTFLPLLNNHRAKMKGRRHDKQKA